MELIIALAAAASILSIPLFLFIALISLIRKKSAKKLLKLTGIAIITLFVCIILTPTCDHTWMDATCTKPKTCSKCNITEGIPLEHNITNWDTIISSTCSTKGTAVGLCTLCQNTITKSLELLPHTEGNWEITKEAVDGIGEKGLKCTVCGEIYVREVFELTPEEIETNYKAQCASYSYEQIARYPAEYNGKYVKFYGQVIQVIKDISNNEITYDLRISTDDDWYIDDVIYAEYTTDISAPRILEDDMVTVYGILDGEYTYTAVLGNQVTLPFMYVEYIDQY